MALSRFRTIAGFFLAGSFLVGSGCQSTDSCSHKSICSPTGTPADAAAGGNVIVGGLVKNKGLISIPSGGLTLLSAIEKAGVEIPKQSTTLTGLFALLSRSDGDHYFAIPLIQSGPVGGIYLRPGETITVVNWTATDLFRGLIAPTIPKFTGDPGDLMSLLNWSKMAQAGIAGKNVTQLNQIANDLKSDDKQVVMKAANQLVDTFLPNASDSVIHPSDPNFEKKVFGSAYVDALVRLAKAQGIPIPTVLDLDWAAIRAGATARELSAGVKDLQIRVSSGGAFITLPPDSARIIFPSSNFPFRIPPPHMSAFIAKAEFAPGSVAILRRTIKGRNSEFILPGRDQPGRDQLGTKTFNQNVILNVVPFDGDTIESNLPANLPIVMASLIAPVVSPNATAADREKAMCCLRNCINSNKPADKCVGVCPINSTSAAKLIASSTVPVLPSTQVPVLVPTPESVPAPAPILPTVPKP